MVGLQGCFDEAGADFGFGRGVLSVHHLHHTRIPEDKTISANLVYIYITWPFYSLFVHSLSLSVCLSVLVPPVTRPFQTCVPPASCLPDTPDSINEQTPPGSAFLNILFTPRLFLFVSLYPCLSSSPFFGVFLLRRAVRAHHRCSLDPLLPSPLSSLSLFFGLSFRTDFSWSSLFLPTRLIIDAFHYPFLPFGLAPFKDVLSLIVRGIWNGLRFMKPKGEIYSASVPLDCFAFIMVFSVMKSLSLINLEKNRIPIILPSILILLLLIESSQTLEN